MKMKELSALTVISDRTIRYYIDDGLFIPEKYTENYEGRRSYEFTENDVKHLKQIALLRKYGFSIGEIKGLVKGEIEIEELLDNKIEEVNQNSEEQLIEIEGLKFVKDRKPKDINALYELLSNSPSESNIQKEVEKKKRKKLYYRMSIILVVFALSISAFYLGKVLIIKLYKPDNEVSYDQVIDRRISSTEIYELKEKYENDGMSLAYFLLKYRPQCIRQSTDDTRYALLRGYYDEMVYVFWNTETNKITNIINKGFRYLSGYEYMENSDFDFVEIGKTHFSEIAHRDDSLISVGTTPNPKSAHITKEGVVIVSYKPEEYDMIVTAIEYYSNDEIPQLKEKSVLYALIPYILPKDKPTD